MKKFFGIIGMVFVLNNSGVEAFDFENSDIEKVKQKVICAMPIGVWVKKNLPKAQWIAYAYNGERFVDLETNVETEENTIHFRLQFQVFPSKIETLDLHLDHIKQSSFVKRGLLARLCQYHASR